MWFVTLPNDVKLANCIEASVCQENNHLCYSEVSV